MECDMSTTEIRLEINLQLPIEEMLREIGHRAVEIMRDKTGQHDYTGDLTESIMWRTAQSLGDKETNVAPDIDGPPIGDRVYVGSAIDYADARENGAGPHVTNYKAEEFTAHISEWALDKGMNPFQYKALVKRIREKGMEPVPFAAPSIEEIKVMASEVAHEYINRFLASKAGK
jgi:hypothetical protein